MSKLLSKARQPDAQGCIQRITPQSAGWHHVGFEAFVLKAGDTLELAAGSTEVCLVLVAGKAHVRTDTAQWRNLGERMTPFEGKAPYAVYAPPGDHYVVEALTDLELAVARAPAEGKYPARLITPADCTLETRGEGSNSRTVCNVLFANLEAEHLLVCEVLTPGGNWSSYPPHKHDRDAVPEETYLEETYYHRINPAQGFAFQRVYTDDRSLDETMSVENRDVVMVPEGYHPVGAPHGYDLYYLNVMAGPRRTWIFNNDPDHEWLIKR